MKQSIWMLLFHKHKRVKGIGNLSCDLEHMRSALALAQGWVSADLGENKKLRDLGYVTSVIWVSIKSIIKWFCYNPALKFCEWMHGYSSVDLLMCVVYINTTCLVYIAYQTLVQSRSVSSLSLSLLLVDPCGNMACSLHVDWGFAFISVTVLPSSWQMNGDASILGSSVCTDIDLMCDYKISLIGAITSLFQDITIYNNVNKLEFIMCLEKSEWRVQLKWKGLSIQLYRR